MGVFWSRGYHATGAPRTFFMRRSSRVAAFTPLSVTSTRSSCVRLIATIADALTRMDIELAPRRVDRSTGCGPTLRLRWTASSGANGRRGCLWWPRPWNWLAVMLKLIVASGAFSKAMEARVADALSRAKAAGKLADGVEPSSAARILVCFVEGLRVVVKTGPTPITSQATADALLDRFIR